MAIDDLDVLKISGTAIPIPGSDMDTDQIAPADSMTELAYSKASMLPYLFRDARKKDPNHPLNNPNYEGASIMVVGRNFGAGSSRETAPQAIMSYGISALVGESFATIFEGNCREIGMPAVTASHDIIEELMELTVREPKTIYTLDILSKTLSWSEGTYRPIELPESTKITLMHGNVLQMLKNNHPKIAPVANSLPYINGFE
ncbi:hypothetical protein HYT53_04445 [Candidatus Woesearchaeota archaeon]|nr:hypothetical protein [Candidatus Woesearchaeota archaeon]